MPTFQPGRVEPGTRYSRKIRHKGSETAQDGVEHRLYDYYPDEISFTTTEFVGLTLDEARRLKSEKDKRFLQS